MRKTKFASNPESCKFIENIAHNLTDTGFPQAAAKLNEILIQGAWTTSSELLGEIKLALLTVQSEYTGRLEPCLSDDIELSIRTIEDTWNKANSNGLFGMV
jgi:hypothetical protein